jgi:hypothetical protein
MKIKNYKVISNDIIITLFKSEYNNHYNLIK